MHGVYIIMCPITFLKKKLLTINSMKKYISNNYFKYPYFF
jgi:hypothetical protein